MFVYIFEDGTVQRNASGPTIEDRNAVEDGLLLVLYSDTDIQTVDENLEFGELTECNVAKCDDGLGEYHAQV